jgi:hypothetical protein
LPAVLHVAARSLDIPHAPLTVLLYSGLAHQPRSFAAQDRHHSAALLALLRHEQVAAGHHAAALFFILLILNIRKPVLGIRIRMFLGLPDPDPLVTRCGSGSRPFSFLIKVLRRLK